MKKCNVLLISDWPDKLFVWSGDATPQQLTDRPCIYVVPQSIFPGSDFPTVFSIFCLVCVESCNSEIIKWHRQCTLIIRARSMGMTYFLDLHRGLPQLLSSNHQTGALHPPVCALFSLKQQFSSAACFNDCLCLCNLPKVFWQLNLFALARWEASFSSQFGMIWCG